MRTAAVGAPLIFGRASVAQQAAGQQAWDEARVCRVESVSRRIIHAIDGRERVALHAGDDVKVWKGKSYPDLSPLRPGDTIVVRLHRDPSGKLIADEIWANIITFYGVIDKVSGNRVQIVVDPRARKRETRTIIWSAHDTAFEHCLPEDIIPGRDTWGVGLDLGGGTVEATRIVVYENHRPVRMPADARVIPRMPEAPSPAPPRPGRK